MSQLFNLAMRRTLPLALGLFAVLLLTAPASARPQFGVEWASFSPSPGSLGDKGDGSGLSLQPSDISNNSTEVDFAWGDVDSDGDTDLIVVRKQPFTTAGKRVNFLLRNDDGVLNNVPDLVSDADVPGDQGFNTPTNDRDVFLSDLDLDGTLDVITATTVSDSDPKHIGHPRIYMNKGGVGAAWLGYRFEDARMPILLHYNTGQPRNPRFCSVAAGDVTGDGFPELYFGDYDSSEEGFQSQQPPNSDLNDRLLVNDGNAFFSDQSQSRMTTEMLFSNFGMAVVIADFNLNGVNDILKNTSLLDPRYVSISYNNPNNVGQFQIFHKFHTGFEAYHTSEGDLNNDGRLDVINTDDSNDRFRINTGVDALGRATWSPGLTFDFLQGGDQGFGGNNLVADLNMDGWDDVIITDVDVDIPGCNRRTNIYHNKITQVGASSAGAVSLLEERQNSSGNGWLGVVGMSTNDLRGGHDVAVFDLDDDGDNDMILGRCTGTFVWTNNLDGDPPPPPPGCGLTQYGPNTGANVASISSPDSPVAGSPFTFELSGFNGNGTGLLVIATAQANQSGFGGTLLVNLQSSVLGAGNYFNIPIVGGSGSHTMTIPSSAVGVTVYTQAAMLDGSQPAGLAMTDGMQILVCP